MLLPSLCRLDTQPYTNSQALQVGVVVAGLQAILDNQSDGVYRAIIANNISPGDTKA